jgi:polar amino acid transport system substrate-binding protein
MTVTATREEVLDFTQAYYYTPAQMGATTESGITDLAGLSGQTVCTGESTTYAFWLEGTLELAGGVPEPSEPPADVTVTTFGTDTECSDSVEAGRTDFQAWLTAGPTLKLAIAGGVPFVEIGDPVFYEALAVAIDKQSPTHTELLAEIDRIIGEMHEDGTLSALSEEWFGVDYTVTE